MEMRSVAKGTEAGAVFITIMDDPVVPHEIKQVASAMRHDLDMMRYGLNLLVVLADAMVSDEDPPTASVSFIEPETP